MSWNYKEDELKLYYLYMAADGEISYEEEKLFEQLCREFEIDADTKREIIAACKSLISGGEKSYSIIVRERIDEESIGQYFVDNEECHKASMLWNLINLGYADIDYSEEEKNIVRYLVDRWGIAPEVYQEMIDTAETMLALTKQKEWLFSTMENPYARSRKERALDEEIARLKKSVELTIEEVGL